MFLFYLMLLQCELRLISRLGIAAPVYLSFEQGLISYLHAIEQAFAVVDHLAKLKGVTLKVVNINDEDLAIFANIFSDKDRYVQVIVNFLSNAIKFSKKN